MPTGRGAEVRLDCMGQRYGTVRAVKPLAPVIEGGARLGPSGCGKRRISTHRPGDVVRFGLDPVGWCWSGA